MAAKRNNKKTIPPAWVQIPYSEEQKASPLYTKDQEIVAARAVDGNYLSYCDAKIRQVIIVIGINQVFYTVEWFNLDESTSPSIYKKKPTAKKAGKGKKKMSLSNQLSFIPEEYISRNASSDGFLAGIRGVRPHLSCNGYSCEGTKTAPCSTQKTRGFEFLVVWWGIDVVSGPESWQSESSTITRDNEHVEAFRNDHCKMTASAMFAAAKTNGAICEDRKDFNKRIDPGIAALHELTGYRAYLDSDGGFYYKPSDNARSSSKPDAAGGITLDAGGVKAPSPARISPRLQAAAKAKADASDGKVTAGGGDGDGDGSEEEEDSGGGSTQPPSTTPIVPAGKATSKQTNGGCQSTTGLSAAVRKAGGKPLPRGKLPNGKRKRGKK
jgi:hypothetical protein